MAERFPHLDEIVPGYHSNLSVHVYVENVDRNISEDDLWRRIEIKSYGGYIHKRLARDPNSDNCLRASIIYNNRKYATKVAREISGRHIGPRFLRAEIASDKIKYLESHRTITKSLCDIEFDGEIFVSGFNIRFGEKHLKEMFKNFGVQSVTLIRDLDGNSTGAAVVKLPGWKSATGAEIAFDGIDVEGGKLYVIAKRSKQQVVSIPWKLVKLFVDMSDEFVKETSSGTDRSTELKPATTATEKESSTEELTVDKASESGAQVETIKSAGGELISAEISDSENPAFQVTEIGPKPENDSHESTGADGKKQEAKETEDHMEAAFGEEKEKELSTEPLNREPTPDTEESSLGDENLPQEGNGDEAKQKLEQIGRNMKELSTKKHVHFPGAASGQEKLEFGSKLQSESSEEQSPVASSTESAKSSGLRLQFPMEGLDSSPEEKEQNTCKCKNVCQCTCECVGSCNCSCKCKDHCQCNNRP